ncbi:glycosyltransferase family 2 protein [Acinetobacter larvae]|uniref:Glycosyl transferase n=1 Tax=Acinetobacter larvae TaxID=1789224 RepID=A0A1B2M2B0_9GAMM|nr:glycosyltransferase family 2 protein [Acinetobacter larvae]AOA59291.1 glycosyl transferase [Acinetobacter larvae]
MSYCFVVPVYNHPHYLTALLTQLKQYGLPIYLVNDGSDASCSALLRQLAQDFDQVALLEHAHNMGKGQAVMTGLTHAYTQGMTHALQIDADGQHHWPDIARFLETSAAHPDAVVIGQPIYDATVPKKRLYARYLTHIWVWINTLSFDIHDSMCGFRVYPLAATCKVLAQAKLGADMSFDSEILVRLKWHNAVFINLPTAVIYPEQGISHFHLWKDNLGLTKSHARLFAGMLCRLPQLLKQKHRAPQQLSSRSPRQSGE